MTDLGTITLNDGTPLADVEPVTFTFTYRDTDGEEVADTFRAHGTLPFAYLVEYWSDPNVSGTPAAIAFFSRALLPDDWPRFYTLITDPAKSASSDALATLLRKLIVHYETVDPTTARSGGPAKSPGGRPRTGRGSSASRRAKASTSR